LIIQSQSKDVSDLEPLFSGAFTTQHLSLQFLTGWEHSFTNQ